jgi:hypothetical protein
MENKKEPWFKVAFKFLLKDVPSILVGGGILLAIIGGLSNNEFLMGIWYKPLLLGSFLYFLEFLAENTSLFDSL